MYPSVFIVLSGILAECVWGRASVCIYGVGVGVGGDGGWVLHVGGYQIMGYIWSSSSFQHSRGKPIPIASCRRPLLMETQDKAHIPPPSSFNLPDNHQCVVNGNCCL